MKKIMYLLFGVLLTFTACNSDLDNATTPLEDGMSRLSIGVSQGAKTRSATNPAQAPVIEGVHARYILEIYHVSSTAAEGALGELYLRKVQIATPDVQSPHVFDFRLISQQKYNFLIWVDYVANGSDDLHYDTSNGLNNIVLKNSTYKNFDHSRDAFFTSFTKENVDGTFTEVPECKRPFGQLNIKTSDWSWVADQKIVNPHITPTTIEFGFNAPKSFNVFTKTPGTVDDTAPYAYIVNVPATGILENLTCDYIFAPPTGQLLINPTMVFKNEGGEEVTNATDLLKNIPIERNYKTNVTGNLLTKTGDLSVKVDPIWDNSNEELVRPEEQASTFHILPNDPNLKMIEGVYTYTLPVNIVTNNDAINLIFDEKTITADFPSRAITIVIPSGFPQTIASINIEANLVKSPLSFVVNAPEYTGNIRFIEIKHAEFPSEKVEYNFDNLTVNIPNGSALIGDNIHVKGDVTFIVKDATLTINESAVITGNLVGNAGRVNVYGKVQKNATMNNAAWMNLYGTVDGTIYVNNEAKVDVWRNGQAKHYYTSSISDRQYSQWKGFGVGVGDAIDLILPEFALPEFLNIGVRLNYSGAYAKFDFGDHTTGFNWKTFRNLRYDFYNNAATPAVAATSTLKEDIRVNVPTLGDVQNTINHPMNELKEVLAKKIAALDALLNNPHINHLPPTLKAKLIAEIEKLKSNLHYYIKEIPTLQAPTGMPTIPLATFIPAKDNFEVTTIINLIGKPGDKFNIADIGGYIDGSKNLSIYMIINFLSDYQATAENLAALKAEKDQLTAEKEGLNTEKEQILEEKNVLKTHPKYVALTTEFEQAVANYEASPAPSPLLGPWLSYSIAAAIEKPAFESGGNYFLNKWGYIYGENKVPVESKNRINEKNRLIDIVEAKVDAREAWLAEAAGPLEGRLLAINARIKAIDDRINGTLGQLFLDGLNPQILATQTQVSVLEAAFTQLGIPKETVQTITDVLLAITPYLTTATDILNTVNKTIVKIESYNPFKYEQRAPSTTVFSKLGIDAKFEYETEKLIYVRSNQ